MKKIGLIVLLLVVLAAVILYIADRLFYKSFRKQTDKALGNAGPSAGSVVTEKDLERLPPVVAKFMRYSGVLEKKRARTMRLHHTGTFRPGADRKMMPIKGEYALTADPPAFLWFGRIRLLPGITFSAFDGFFEGRGQMKVKVLSLMTVVDSHSAETTQSAFGRCVAEMSMMPSFFLDERRIAWTASGEASAACTVTEGGLTAKAEMFFGADGRLEKIVVERYYERGGGTSTLEKFTGAGSEFKDFDGLRLASVFDGYWNLKEGDLHYVHFVIDQVEVER
jgi:hypothetical protein